MRSRQLKALRVYKGYTVADASKAIGRACGSYSKKESGQTSFNDSEKIVLAKMLDMTFDQFNEIFFDGQLQLKA